MTAPHQTARSAAIAAPSPPQIQGPGAAVAGRIPLLHPCPMGAEAAGQTLWIRGTAPGVAVGQARFHSAERGGAPLQGFCLAEAMDGRFEAPAPAWGPDVHGSVVSRAADAEADAAHPWVAPAAPVAPAVADPENAFLLGACADWVVCLRVPPEPIAGVGDVFPR